MPGTYTHLLYLGAFGSLAWNKSEDKIAYVAEKRIPKSVSYFTDSKSGNLNGRNGEVHVSCRITVIHLFSFVLF